MAIYHKSSSIQGNWVKASELKSGSKAVLITQVEPMESNFTNKDGSPQTQDVAKIRIEGEKEVKNVRVNKPTINGFVAAFGEDSEKWTEKPLIIQTERMIVGGKRVTALYLIPEGFELREDEGGYLVITKIIDKSKAVKDMDIPVINPEGDEPDEKSFSEDEDIDPEKIPF